MKLRGPCPFIILIILLSSCDRVAIIAQKSAPYDARRASVKIESTEKLPTGVKELLVQTDSKSPAMKFPVPYFLIEQDNIDFTYSHEFPSEIISQLNLTVSGVKYYKFFVHPDSDENYAFLKSAYRYIDHTQTEFMASMLNEERTLVLWSKANTQKMAFVVKTRIDEKTKKGMNPREPAAYYEEYIPNMITIFLRRPAQGPKEKIEGQLITEVPQI